MFDGSIADDSIPCDERVYACLGTSIMDARISALWNSSSHYQHVYNRGYGDGLETPQIGVCNECSHKWGQATGSSEIGDDVCSFDCRHVHL